MAQPGVGDSILIEGEVMALGDNERDFLIQLSPGDCVWVLVRSTQEYDRRIK